MSSVKISVDINYYKLSIIVRNCESLISNRNKLIDSIYDISYPISYRAEAEYYADEFINNEKDWRLIEKEIREGAVFDESRMWSNGAYLNVEIGKNGYKILEVYHGEKIDIPKIFRKNFPTRLFPSPSEVFYSSIDLHSKYLTPYAILPLDLVIPDCSIKVPFVVPFEPHNGRLGDYGEPYHTYYSRIDWMGFDLIDNKLKFDSDFSYFCKHQIDNPKKRVPNLSVIDEREIIESYEKESGIRNDKIKDVQSSHESTFILGQSSTYPSKRYCAFSEIGGKVNGGNYQNWILGRDSKDWDGNSRLPLDENGNEMIYLGTLNSIISEHYIIGFISNDYKKVSFACDWG